MRVFVNQTAIKLILETGINFNEDEVIQQQVLVIEPGGQVLQWEANKLSGEETKGSIFIDFSNNVKFTKAGHHKIRASLTFADGRLGIGRWVNVLVSA